MEEEAYLHAPLGLMFVTMGENHEQVSFTYPFAYDQSNLRTGRDSCCSPPLPLPERPTYTNAAISGFVHFREPERSDALLYGVPTSILAHLLSAKGMCDAPFEIKIDNFRFAGFPKTVSEPSTRSPQIFHVVFVLVANAPAHLVTSFQTLSRKLALAIDEEQSRCGYLADQMTTMLNEHDKNESLPNADESLPYRDILEQSSLAQELRDVFEDVCDYGMVHVLINECVEIGFCIETRAHVHAGLTPKSRTEVESIVRRIRPYHGILLLEESIPSPDSNPSVRLILKHCEPDRSIIGMSNASGLPVVQVLLVVRHLLLWARAVVIYPLCSSNIYTSATHPKPLMSLAEQFGELFENASLAGVLAEFCPPCTLAEFINASVYSQQQQRVRLRMVARLLRDELIMQLHTFLYLLPPFSNQPSHMSALDTLQDQNIGNMIRKAQMTSEIKGTVAKLCATLLSNSTSEQVESTLALFIRLLPYLNGEHHIEDMMYRMNLERSVIVRVLDTFASVLATFSRPDFISQYLLNGS